MGDNMFVEPNREYESRHNNEYQDQSLWHVLEAKVAKRRPIALVMEQSVKKKYRPAFIVLALIIIALLATGALLFYQLQDERRRNRMSRIPSVLENWSATNSIPSLKTDPENSNTNAS